MTPLPQAIGGLGIVYPDATIQAAAVANIDLAAACAMLMMETGGGNDEFGHDGGNAVQGGPVTEQRYRELRASIAAGAPSNGVGPCQLTSVFLLDAADRIGGAWIPEKNMIIGFRYLAALIREYGSVQLGFQHYNGAGPAAVTYGQRAIWWIDRFRPAIASATAAPPPDPHRYALFDTTDRDLGRGRRGNERQLVREYDRERARWLRFPHRLHVLRDDLSVLAARVEERIDDDPANNAANHRQWRHGQLDGRAKGQRFA